MSECKCSMVTSLVGDGCQTCNPQMVIDMLNDEIKEVAEQRDELLADLKVARDALRNMDYLLANKAIADVIAKVEAQA